jgi:hypothetical protein
MQRRLFSSLLGLAIVMALPRVACAAEDDLSGFTLQQLGAAITKGGLATQKIYSILTFDSDERRGANIAILSGSHTGWHVTVLHRIQGGLKVEWRSDKLPNDIAVSSSNNFEVEYMDDGEQVVEFPAVQRTSAGGWTEYSECFSIPHVPSRFSSLIIDGMKAGLWAALVLWTSQRMPAQPVTRNTK